MDTDGQCIFGEFYVAVPGNFTDITGGTIVHPNPSFESYLRMLGMDFQSCHFICLYRKKKQPVSILILVIFLNTSKLKQRLLKVFTTYSVAWRVFVPDLFVPWKIQSVIDVLSKIGLAFSLSQKYHDPCGVLLY